MPTPSRPSTFVRWLEPLVSGLWILFFLWSVLVAVIWTFDIGEAEVHRAIHDPDLAAAILWILNSLDVFWLLLAVANVHLAISSSEGLAIARRRALICLSSGWVLGAAAAAFSDIGYTGRLGMRLGEVPLGAPLLWMAVALGSRECALRILPKARYEIVAAVAGLIALATDLNLEPVAQRLRVWWIWHLGVHTRVRVTAQAPEFGSRVLSWILRPSGVTELSWPPILNFVVWFAGPAILTLAFRETVVRDRSREFPRPIIVFLVLNVVFLLGHIPDR